MIQWHEDDERAAGSRPSVGVRHRSVGPDTRPDGEQRDSRGADERGRDERDEPGLVAAANVAQVADEHGRGRFGDAVSRQDDAHDAAENLDAEQLGGDERDDQIVASESEAEHDGKRIHRRS